MEEGNDNLLDLIADQKWPNKQKKLIIAAAIVIVVLLILIIILIAANSNGEKPSDVPRGDVIGEIICKYIVNDASKKITILGKEYEKGNNEFDIYIGSQKKEYSHELLEQYSSIFS